MCPLSVIQMQCSPGVIHLRITSMMSSSRYSLLHHTALSLHDSYLLLTPTLKLSCRGVQRYRKEGEIVEEEVQFEHLSPSTSRGKETFVTSSLLPNTQYTCSIQSVAGSLSSVPHSDVTFKTEPGSEMTYFGLGE